ncbi:four-carbon acid sugar kinase family protein [Arthrobacter sp. Sa2CUA1]|uniref:3-oxo-tetronate kinase n=1 Tax=Arthrobacter gallicola TaxID=2762225 RepID=A0ABR8UT80_9MICC|nr:3-oxo-tetronate kinase [Arthrobacter gallicola]MBD7995724.1 four-carbon acid sugar kinase family protein [Arthrobacter gallicola]
MSQLGAIADDFTGATDLATNLAKRGFDVIVVPEEGLGSVDNDFSRYEAVVVALKTRTAPVAAAVSDSLRALEFLQSLGCRRFYFKYCSTFDSTDEGNIGPVLDALSSRLGVHRTVVVPSFPDNGRTVVDGVLYVGGDLLEHSSMRTHPLTPMTRSRVSEILQPQTPNPVAEIDSAPVDAGDAQLKIALDSQTARYVVVDAASNAQLGVIARATSDDILVSGGSGLALGLEPRATTTAPPMTVTGGRRLVLSGSASTATRGQVAHALTGMPALKIDVQRLLDDPEKLLLESMDFLAAQDPDAVVLVYAVDSLDDLILSRELATGGIDPAERVEWLLARIAAEATNPAHGFSRIIVAGGETSGAVVRSLGLNSLVIGKEIAPGVCWAFGTTRTGVAVNLALKSGNFGTEDMFTTAWNRLGG